MSPGRSDPPATPQARGSHERGAAGLPPRAMTIAGTDPTGGAGIAQDLRTFAAFGVWGMPVVTAVTVQDSEGVKGWHAIPPEDVRAQIETSAADLAPVAAKTGMIPDARTAYEIARALDAANVAVLVVDPVLRASSGDALGADDLVFAIRELLLPRATVVTPNAHEAFMLTGVEVDDRASQTKAADALVALGANAAVVTGGHLDGTDVLATSDGSHAEIEGVLIGSRATHGTGCVYSAAIAAALALGEDVPAAARRAKDYVMRSIERGVIGNYGRGSVNPPERA